LFANSPEVKWFCDISAHELAKDQRQNFGDDITAVLRLARKRKFMAAEEKCIVEENELHRYLRRLMETDLQRSASVVLCEYSKFRIESNSYFSIQFDSKRAQLFKIF